MGISRQSVHKIKKRAITHIRGSVSFIFYGCHSSPSMDDEFNKPPQVTETTTPIRLTVKETMIAESARITLQSFCQNNMDLYLSITEDHSDGAKEYFVMESTNFKNIDYKTLSIELMGQIDEYEWVTTDVYTNGKKEEFLLMRMFFSFNETENKYMYVGMRKEERK